MIRYRVKEIICGFLLISLTLFLNVNTMARGGPGDVGTPCPEGIPVEDCDPDNVPIDGGVGILLAATVACWVKMNYDRRKAAEEIS